MLQRIDLKGQTAIWNDRVLDKNMSELNYTLSNVAEEFTVLCRMQLVLFVLPLFLIVEWLARRYILQEKLRNLSIPFELEGHLRQQGLVVCVSRWCTLNIA